MGRFPRTAEELVARIGALTPQTWSRSEKCMFEREVGDLLNKQLDEAYACGRREMRADIIDRAALFKDTVLEIERATIEQDKSQGYPMITAHLGALVNRALGGS